MGELASAPERVAKMRRAAARWERVIRGALPPQPLSLPEDFCTAGAPAINREIANVAVIVKIDSVDGREQSLGYADPCAIRNYGEFLPVVGFVVLDRDDFLMTSPTLAEQVIAHEIGHVLGLLGTLWSSLVQDPETPDPRFVGRGARHAA